MSYKSTRYTKEGKKRWLLARASAQANKKDCYGHDKKRNKAKDITLASIPTTKEENNK